MSESRDPKHRGYSYGVRHCVVSAVSPPSNSLLDFVESQLKRESEPPPLTALELLEHGSVYLNDTRILMPSRQLSVGDRVRIHTRPRHYPQPRDLLSRVISETADLLVVDKPAGLPVHALVDNINENLISYLEDLRGGSLFITHRLDVETSGLVLLAKNPETQARLNRAFAEGTISRTYAAYTEKPIAVGAYVHYMEPSPKAPKVVSVEKHEGWSKCELKIISCVEMKGETSAITEGRTSWHLQGEASVLTRVYRLEISLQTGRPQQIRAQLKALGAPIIGDLSYGSHFHLEDFESERSAIALRAIDVIETMPHGTSV